MSQFYHLAEDLGFGELADRIHTYLDSNGDGGISSLELRLQLAHQPPSDPRVRRFLTTLVFEGARAAGRPREWRGFDPSAFAFRHGDDAAFRQAVLTMCARSAQTTSNAIRDHHVAYTRRAHLT